jgi:hypothetical protein
VRAHGRLDPANNELSYDSTARTLHATNPEGLNQESMDLDSVVTDQIGLVASKVPIGTGSLCGFNNTLLKTWSGGWHWGRRLTRTISCNIQLVKPAEHDLTLIYTTVI